MLRQRQTNLKSIRLVVACAALKKNISITLKFV